MRATWPEVIVAGLCLAAYGAGAITAAQRIARQAQTETRTAALARIVRRLLITQGLDQ